MNDEEMISCQDPAKQIDRLRSIMQRLRGEGGCPWDAEQTHESLIPDLIEESYEVIDAIRATDMNHLREELGDLLLQVIFHAEITREKGLFDLDAIACELND
ncbi:MAG: MazG nucleotide pyrophosphohydrolase domain-containing protein, partial [Akkermansia sp.]